MSHIHTEPGQHDVTASAFIIRTNGDEPRAMLHMHKKLGKYLQFGGHVELHENPWQAVTHEIQEESGYTLDELELLQPYARIKVAGDTILHPVPITLNTHAFSKIDHYHSDIGFAFVASKPPKASPAENESQEMVLFTATELKELPKDKIPDNVRHTFLFAMAECLKNWEHVPAKTVA